MKECKLHRNWNEILTSLTRDLVTNAKRKDNNNKRR